MSNPYVEILEAKGYTVRETHTPGLKREFPLMLHGRVYETKEDYNNAVADFLNGN